MLIQRVSLSNFLSYRGVSTSTGKLGPVDIEFYDSTLWLIHGHNGSGKSSIFDAISFALFKKHRGAESTNHAFSYLISDGTDQANIELEIVLNDRRYLIQRQIKRGRKSAKVWGIVREWTGKDWKAVPNTEDNVENWVKDNIRMSYETFVSAVLLRQGEADAFLKAKPKDRKERLLEVLDLDFYKRLGELAGYKRKIARDEVRQLEQKMSTLRTFSEDDIQAQNILFKQIETDLAVTRDRVSVKEKELHGAEQLVKIRKEVGEHEQERNRGKNLIKREAEIAANIRRYRELDGDIPRLQSILDIRISIDSDNHAIDRIRNLIKDENLQLNTLVARVSETNKTLKLANENLDALKKQLEKLLTQKVGLKEQVDQILQIEKIEKQIGDAESELEPYLSVIKQSKSLDKSRERFVSLEDALPALDDLVRARGVLSDAENKKHNLDKELIDLLSEQDQEKENIEEKKKSITGLRKKAATSKSDLESLQTLVRDLKQKIVDREQIHNKHDCPLCGSSLDSDAVHARITREIKEWKSELSTLRQQSKLKESDYRKLENDLTESNDHLEKWKETLTKIKTKVAVCQNKIDNEKIKVRDCNDEIKRIEGKVGKWVSETHNLEALHEELSQLTKNSKMWKQLAAARLVESKVQAIIETKQKDLNSLPQWSFKKRENIRSSLQKLLDDLLSIQDQVKSANDNVRKLEARSSDLNRQKALVAKDIEHNQKSLDDVTKRKLETELQLTKQLARISDRLVPNLDLLDAKFLLKMENEKESLANAEQEEMMLKVAIEQVTKIEGQLVQLDKQLNDIPRAHHRAVDIVRSELEEINCDLQDVQRALNAASEDLGKMKSGLEDYKEHQNALEKVQTQFGYYSKLADAFGSSGLQAQIIQEAQKTIKEAANTTLRFLSNGAWQIELAGDDQELEILAQDISQPGMPKRPFEYLSGSEKFRVAISLAVAIGQSISGGRTVDTLIIDEGFGSLDEINRDNLVAELRRLSDDVLDGGRVIIVSHEDDICDEFVHRLKISKSIDGVVSVER